jgi:predicted DNA-binding transcriptional regulator AlpA
MSKLKTELPNVPIALAEAALIAGPTCAATGGVSLSWWHEEVRAGRAPKPAIQRPRFTRWRLADVAAYWRNLADAATHDTQVKQRAAQASIKALATRKKRAAERAEA